MRNPSGVVFDVFCLVLKASFLLVGVALVVALVSKEEKVPSEKGTAPEAKPVFMRDDGGNTFETINGDPNDGFSRFVIRDKTDRELMNFHIYKNNELIFNVHNGMPVRLTGHTMTNGSIGLGVRSGKIRYRLAAHADGSSSLEVFDVDKDTLCRFRITSDGTLINDSPKGTPIAMERNSTRTPMASD